MKVCEFMGISIEKILENKFYIIDCLFDNNYYSELKENKEDLKKFSNYFVNNEENLKDIKKLIKEGKYAEFVNLGRGTDKNKLVKDTVKGALADVVSSAIPLPLSVLTPIAKDIYQNLSGKHRNEEELIEKMVDEIIQEHIKNNIESRY